MKYVNVKKVLLFERVNNIEPKNKILNSHEF
jgi:hypothetical protein